jgi:hypothetical protein
MMCPFSLPWEYDISRFPLKQILEAVAREDWSLYHTMSSMAVNLRPDLFGSAEERAGEMVSTVEVHSLGEGWASVSVRSYLQEHKPNIAFGTAGPTSHEKALIALVTSFMKHGPGATPISVLDSFCDAWFAVHSWHPNPVKLEAVTLEAFLSWHLPWGDVLEHFYKQGGSITWRHAVREPVVVFRAPSWVFSCLPLLRVLLRILGSLLCSSKVEIRRACRFGVLQSELAHRPPPDASEANGFHEMASVPTKLTDGQAISLLQGAIIVQCLLSACIRYPTCADEEGRSAMSFLECRQHVCTFLQDIILEDPRVIMLLVQKGLSVAELGILLDGVPAMQSVRFWLASIYSGCSIADHARSFTFLLEYARRYPSEETFFAARQAVTNLTSTLSMATLQVCYNEGEDVVASMRCISRCILGLVSVFPSLRLQVAEPLIKALQTKEMESLRRGGSGVFKEIPSILEQAVSMSELGVEP